MALRIIIREQRQIDHAIARIQSLNIESPWDITIKPYKRNRSLEQNNTYWDWIDDLAKAQGYSKQGMHIGMMEEHLKPTLTQTPNGIREEYSTKGLNVKQMAEYMEKIEFTAGLLGIALRHPDDQGR